MAAAFSISDLAPARIQALAACTISENARIGRFGGGQGSVVIGRSKPTRCLLADRSARVQRPFSGPTNAQACGPGSANAGEAAGCSSLPLGSHWAGR